MQILPVLDLKDGWVVRGIAGQREKYRPIASHLTDSAIPIDVALSFRNHFQLSELYVADLNAIAGDPPALETFKALRKAGFRLWIDPGIHNVAQVSPDWTDGQDTVIAGLETVDGPKALRELCQQFEDRLVFSLDLKDGQPLGDLKPWQTTDAVSIAKQAIEMGVTRLLILDLAKVGVGEGPGALATCRDLLADFPEVQIGAGGGVRHREDLNLLRETGVSFVLIASALHDGQLTLNDLQ